MKTKHRHILSLLLILALVLPITTNPTTGVTAAKIKLTPGRVTLGLPGSSRTVRIQGLPGKKIQSIRIRQGNEEIAFASKIGKAKIKVIATGVGETSVRLSVKLKKSVKGKKKYSFQLPIKVNGSDDDYTEEFPTVSGAPTKNPVASATPDNSSAPSATSTPDRNLPSRFFIYSISDQAYTGSAIKPKVTLCLLNDTSKCLKEKYYTVTYQNNVNVGTATVIARGTNGYTGELKSSFRIVRSASTPAPSGAPTARPTAVPGSTTSPTATYTPVPGATTKPLVRLPKQAIGVGETIQLETDSGEGSFSYRASTYSGDESPYITLTQNGKITGVEPGITLIYAESNTTHSKINVGTLYVCNDKTPYLSINPNSGVLKIYGDYKSFLGNITFSSDTGKITVKTLGSCSRDYMKEHVRVEVEDVTPVAFKRVFKAMGLRDDVLKTTSEETDYASYSDTMFNNVFTMRNKTPLAETSISYKKSEIQVSRGIRDIKVTVYADNEEKDIAYVCLMPRRETENDLDTELYDAVRRKVEEKLWTAGMSNKEKLYALSNYINSTAHYPDTAATDKSSNPGFWNDWSVDGMELHYFMFNTPTMNRAMDLQGGIITCQAADIILTAATKDLNLKGLVDGNSIMPGEGVWIGMGSASTNPSAPMHETLWYKDSSENRYAIDTQGKMGADGSQGWDANLVSLE